MNFIKITLKIYLKQKKLCNSNLPKLFIFINNMVTSISKQGVVNILDVLGSANNSSEL